MIGLIIRIIAGSGVAGGTGSDVCDMDLTGKCKGGTLAPFIANGVQALFVVAGIISVFVIIYGGFLMMTSGGDPGKVQKGKSAVFGAVIGLIISILAFAIVKYVVESVG